MIKIAQQKSLKWLIKGVFEEQGSEEIIKKTGAITEDLSKHEAYLFLGKKADYKWETLKEVSVALLNYRRDFALDTTSLVANEVKNACVVYRLVEDFEYKHGKIYNAKTKLEVTENNIELLNVEAEGKATFNEILTISKARTWVRHLQATPPNILNSETYAELVKKEFQNLKNVKVTILGKKEIENEKMGLLLSVNKGSAYEPQVVILEYKNNPTSKELPVIVGKGITFDSGGMNIKTGQNMLGMKYDMSGSAVAAGTIKAVAELELKTNVTAVLVITDNMISNVASTPDAVWTAMNGKTVEINNTDAEGRLALADGLTYAAKKLGATRLIDIATLTGAIIVALGETFSGAWTTTDKAWEDLNQAAKKADELVWRMPLHKDYLKNITASKVADLKNTDLSGKAGSSSAAGFLTQFIEGKEYIHLDIAGTDNINDLPTAPLLKTLVEMVR